MNSIAFTNTYARLPEEFYSHTDPTPVETPSLIKTNDQLASELGIDLAETDKKTIIDVFSGNTIAAGSEPLAMAYAGHQFGGFSHQLGDGRAILLGEVIGKNNKRYDIQLKGSGPTPWSRGGDGRSALGPVLREYLVSEAMHKLGVPTTRALVAVTSGESVLRQDGPVAGGILTRVASGFVRVGTFEYFSVRQNLDAIRKLADYEIERHYPSAAEADNPYIEFLKQVVDRQAALIAQWMQFGFIHGVMNTDNMSISGETIDYGPCAFMDEFQHDKVYSSIDRNGRYAYNNQPQIGQWNLIRLAETLLPLFTDADDKPDVAVEIAQDILKNYQQLYLDYWLQGMNRKLGFSQQLDDDAALVGELLDIMHKDKADFTLVFYHLAKMRCDPADDSFKLQFNSIDLIDAWLDEWQQRLQKDTTCATEQQGLMQRANPLYIPRNHQIEAAIRAAEDHNDFSVFHTLHDVLQKPFEKQAGKDRYMLPPKPEEVVQQTFCGT